MLFVYSLLQIDYMVEYIEKQFGERATNGDKQEAVTLQAKIAELEQKLEKQKALSASTAEETKKDMNSEDETDEDVSEHKGFQMVVPARILPGRCKRL